MFLFDSFFFSCDLALQSINVLSMRLRDFLGLFDFTCKMIRMKFHFVPYIREILALLSSDSRLIRMHYQSWGRLALKNVKWFASYSISFLSFFLPRYLGSTRQKLSIDMLEYIFLWKTTNFRDKEFYEESYETRCAWINLVERLVNYNPENEKLAF